LTAAAGPPTRHFLLLFLAIFLSTFSSCCCCRLLSLLGLLLLGSFGLHAINRGGVLHDHAYLVAEHHRTEEREQRAEDQHANRHGRYCCAESLTLIILFALVAGDRYAYQGPCRRHHRVKIEKQERLLVPQADAIVHPGAMMVHFEYTAPARAAMVRPGWLSTTTLLAAHVHLVFQTANFLQRHPRRLNLLLKRFFLNSFLLA